MDLVGCLKKGQSTNFRAEDELPLEAQSIVLSHDNDIVSATRNSRYTRFVMVVPLSLLLSSCLVEILQCLMKKSRRKHRMYMIQC